MSEFYVGQRVKALWKGGEWTPQREGTVKKFANHYICVDVDDVEIGTSDGFHYFIEEELEAVGPRVKEGDVVTSWRAGATQYTVKQVSTNGKHAWLEDKDGNEFAVEDASRLTVVHRPEFKVGKTYRDKASYGGERYFTVVSIEVNPLDPTEVVAAGWIIYLHEEDTEDKDAAYFDYSHASTASNYTEVEYPL